MKPIKELIQGEEYDFLNTNEHLQGNIMFLVYGGSHAYGTSTPTSDIDIRGCAFNRKQELLGLSSFEQVVDDNSDTVVYGFNKLVNLLLSVNPDLVGMLGSKPEHYLMVSPIAQELLDNRKMFLSRRAIHTFGGYATQQLRRLQNAIARDALTDQEKEKHIMGSIKNAMMSFNERYTAFDEGAVNIYLGESEKEYEEIMMDVNLQGYPLRDYKSLWSEMNEIVKAYGKLNKRNRKKDELHLNKHAMHLIRLYLMAIDIFEKEEIITYREDDLDVLIPIRNGKYMNDDGTYQAEFFELLSEYEKKFEYAVENSSLPARPNFKQVEEFVMSVNERVVRQ